MLTAGEPDSKRPKLLDDEGGTAERKVLRIAAVGCGVIWRHHVDIVAALVPRRLVYTAIVEPDADRRAAAVKTVHAKFGGDPPRGFATLAEAVAADPLKELFQAVDIMVPNLGNLHEKVVIDALRADRHTLLEKPIAVSVAGGERIVAAGRELAPKCVLMCAENSQYWHEVVAAKRLIDAGAIGDLLTVRAKYFESAHPKLNEWAADGSYDPGSFTAEGDEGFVFDGGLHWLRPLRMLLGNAVRVSAVAGKTIPHMKGPGMMQALINFECGVTAVFESVLAPGAISDQPFFVIQGTKGEIVLDGFEGGGRVYRVQDGALHAVDINKGFEGPVGWDTGYAGEMRDFVAAVLDGKCLEAGPQEAVEDLRLMLALMKAAKTKQWESVAAVDGHADMGNLGLKLQ